MVQTLQDSLSVLAEADKKFQRQALENLRKKWIEKNNRPAVEHIDSELKKLEERKNAERRSDTVPEQKD
jgi:hypothetical protein